MMVTSLVSGYLGAGPVQTLAELAGYCPLVRGLALTLATHTFAPAFAHQAPLVPAQILNIVYMLTLVTMYIITLVTMSRPPLTRHC